jgi:hypothetical protein
VQEKSLADELLLEFLRSPTAYPDKPEKVEIRQTHISIKSAELLRDTIQICRGDGIPRQVLRQEAFLGQPSYLHRVIDRKNRRPRSRSGKHLDFHERRALATLFTRRMAEALDDPGLLPFQAA